MNSCSWSHPCPELDEAHQNILPNASSTALLIVDMQEYFRYEGSSIMPNIKALYKTAKELQIPVFMTQHGHEEEDLETSAMARFWGNDLIMKNTKPWMLMKELKSNVLEHGTKLIPKNRYDAFYKTELEARLKEKGVKTVIITGVLTNMCCETTARSAFMRDFDVIVIGDACAAATEEMHTSSLLTIAYGVGRVMSCAHCTELLLGSKTSNTSKTKESSG